MISTLLVTLSITQLASIILIVILFLLGFKILETTWSYKISKPYCWEEAIRKGTVSKKLKKIERSYRDKVRFYTFWFQIERLKKDQVQGAFAEVGVYKGETARMIHEMERSRRLLLFDTFEGFAECDLQFENRTDEKWNSIDFADTNVDAVKQFIGGSESIEYFPGHFPETANSLPHETYALVHLDADLYQPTLEGLKYFYPKLSAGGVILVHDYNHNWEGVRKAVDEFVPTIHEMLVFIPDWQGSVMIIKNR